MNPLEQIKEGIISGDIDEICAAYNTMTGENISPKEVQNKERGLSNIEDLVCEIENILNAYKDKETKTTESCATVKKTKAKRGRPKGSKNNKKKNDAVVKPEAQTVSIDGEDVGIVETEASVDTAFGKKKIKYIGAEFNEEEHEASKNIAKMSNLKKRAPASEKTCDFCGGGSAYQVSSNEKSVMICNSCLLKRKHV